MATTPGPNAGGLAAQLDDTAAAKLDGQDWAAEEAGEADEVDEMTAANVKRETRATGGLSGSLYTTYIKAMGTGLFAATVINIIIGYGAMAFMDLWITIWVDEAEGTPGGELTDARNLYYSAVYIGAAVGFTLFILAGSLLYAVGGYNASQKVHHDTLSRILRAPFSWFQDTPMGRITSRFTTDLGTVDFDLSFSMDNTSQLGVQFVVMLGVIVSIVPAVAITVVIAAVMFWFATEAVNRSNREVRRETNGAMGPVQSNIVEANHAKELARVMKCETFFIKRHHRVVNEYNRANFASFSLLSFMQLAGVYASFPISVFTGVYIIADRASVDVARGALALTYSFVVPYFLSSLASMSTQMKAWFTSYERVLQFTTIPQEPPHELESDANLTHWPAKGEIKFENTQLRYAPHMPLVLRGISLTIPGGSRVGVVGRTGAGKSSLLSLVFRLVESSGGSTLIDGIKTGAIGLSRLRKSISIIPQDPILMVGSVRYNLDPFGTKTDFDLCNALEKAHLSKDLLDSQVAESGGNLSAGQRQLLCFARALLFRAPIVIMDEPTASCDQETDGIIQTMVRNEFKGTTVVTIAHRLETVVDSDAILVLGAGKVLEYGIPADLLAKESGDLTQMARALGSATHSHLIAKANEAKEAAVRK